jgi:D-threo-aldose 1-dehydrogenase
MSVDPAEVVSIGTTGVAVTRLGFGAASIGGLFAEVEDEDARATIEHAYDMGIRYFDVAPLYGYGAAERRLGAVLQMKPRDSYVVSTKVGRLVRRAADVVPGSDIDRQRVDDGDDALYAGIGDRRIVFDFSSDGVRRSLDESLERLGLDRIDVVFIHDPDDHWRDAIEGAYPALHRLRAEGIIRALGVGMSQIHMLDRFARETEIDAILLAGRFTLLDQTAGADLLPTCQRRGIAVIVGGVMNSGVLASPGSGGRYDYRPAPADIVERARAIGAICERHGVPIKAAAVQFPFGHSAVAGLVAGVRSIDHLDEYPGLMQQPIPRALWGDLRDAGLIAP